MKKWVTEIRAIDPTDGEIKRYSGPWAFGDTLAEAVRYCQENGMGYAMPVGEFVEEVDPNAGPIPADNDVGGSVNEFLDFSFDENFALINDKISINPGIKFILF